MIKLIHVQKAKCYAKNTNVIFEYVISLNILYEENHKVSSKAFFAILKREL